MSILPDIRFGLRMLSRNPGSTTIAVLILALGIGINTAIFGVLDSALLKPLPVRHPEELVMLTDPNASLVLGGLLTGPRSLLSYPEFVQLRDRTKTLSGLCASQLPLQRWPVRISGGPREQARGRLVSENYFSVFGVEPALGRFFTQRDATGIGRDPYVVIGYDYWQRRFGGNPSVLGTPIRFYQTTLVIIGVAPKSFRGETVGQDPEFWLPMLMQPAVMPGVDGLHEDLSQSQNKLMWLHVFGRRKIGVGIAQVQSEINVLFGEILEAGYPTTMSPQARKRALDQHIVVTPVGTGAFHGRNEFSKQWTILSALAGLVLLIACANIANLLLARATARSREVAIRLSIGAAKGHLVRQFLTESLLLATLGGSAGIFIAAVACRALPLLLSHADPGFDLALAIDPRVLGFAACTTLLTGILFGLVPALRAARTSLSQAVKQTSSSPRTPFARALLVAQLALSFLLVTGAGLFLRTLSNLESVALGYPPKNLLLIEVDSSARTVNFGRELTERMQTIPGVRSVTYSDRGLFSGFEGAFAVSVEGFTSPKEKDMGSTGDSVGPGYFSTIGIPMLLGREIGPQDTAKSLPVCVINEAFAENFFAGRNPIGKHITSTLSDDQGKPTRRAMEVIGVAKNARVHSLRGKVDPKFYTAANQTGAWPSVVFEVRTTTDPKRMFNAVRTAILAIDADLDIKSERTLGQVLAEQSAQPRLIAQLCTIFGILALILAAAGIYGVLSYNVGRRTNEIGIRMALGATKSLVTGMILRETGFLIVTGVIVGMAATAATARLIATQLYGFAASEPRWSLASYQHVDSATQLYGVNAMDPLTIGAALIVLCTVAWIAAYIPAARAARVDPLVALRHE